MSLHTPNIKDRINTLKTQVQPYSKKTYETKSFLSSFSLSSPIIYAVIPIIVLVILFLIRPSIIMTNIVDEEDNTVETLSLKKLLLWTIITGGVLDIALFAYNYKKKKALQT